MTTRNRDGMGMRAFAVPVVLILGLLSAHWLLSEGLPWLSSASHAASQ